MYGSGSLPLYGLSFILFGFLSWVGVLNFNVYNYIMFFFLWFSLFGSCLIENTDVKFSYYHFLCNSNSFLNLAKFIYWFS